MAMSGGSAKRPATYEDLLAVPDSLIAEIVDGELVTSPRLDDGTWRLVSSFAGDVKVRAAPFDAVEIDLAAIWTPWGVRSPRPVLVR